MTSITDWQSVTGRSWAAEQARTDRSFGTLTPHLLDAIAAEPGHRIVDLGCGAGELSLAVAAARPAARVIGVDVSDDLIRAARARPGLPGNVAFEQADASAWIDPEGPVDLYMSRHGVMFFPDPQAAFAHLAGQARPGARIVFSCFRAAADNVWASGLAALLPPSQAPGPAALPQPHAPGPFAFADPAHVAHCMAGWRDLDFEPVDFRYVAGTGPDPVADALDFLGRIGPAAAALRTLPEGDRPAVLTRLAAFVRDHARDGEVSFPAAAWIVRATVAH